MMNKFTTKFMTHLVDDPIDAFAIHGGGGLVGLLTAPFLIGDGILYSWDQKSAEVNSS
jgi:ammonia channel protein AmtB